MAISCPKCASRDAYSLSLIHRDGGASRHAASVLSRAAAPPRKRSIAGRMLLTTLSGAALAFSLRGRGAFGLGTGLVAAVFVACIVLVMKARRYNAEHPVRLSRWERSVICARCGAVFTWAG
jgi:hypothetical protein